MTFVRSSKRMPLRMILLSAALFESVTIVHDSCAMAQASASWQPCDVAPVAHQQTFDGGYFRLFVWIGGVSVPHQGYRVDLVIKRPLGEDIADAWRFDDAGCQREGTHFVDVRGPQTTTVCPDFHEEVGGSALASIQYIAETRQVVASVTNLYPASGGGQDPGRNYFLARFVFDETFGTLESDPPTGLCGDLGAEVCVKVTSVAVLLLDGSWISIPVITPPLTASDSAQSITNCDLVLARPSTWGKLKTSYRR